MGDHDELLEQVLREDVGEALLLDVVGGDEDVLGPEVEVVVVIVLLGQDKLISVPGVLQLLLRRCHGVVGGALLGVHHAPDDQDDQEDRDDQDDQDDQEDHPDQADLDDFCVLPDLLLGGQAEAGLHDPPVGVRPGSVELGTRFESLPGQGLRVGREGLGLDWIRLD